MTGFSNNVGGASEVYSFGLQKSQIHCISDSSFYLYQAYKDVHFNLHVSCEQPVGGKKSLGFFWTGTSIMGFILSCVWSFHIQCSPVVFFLLTFLIQINGSHEVFYLGINYYSHIKRS